MPRHAAPTQQSAPRHAAQHWPAASYSYISSYPERRVLSALHMQVVLCCVALTHPSIQAKARIQNEQARNQTTTTTKKRKTHTQGTHASISPHDAQMPCLVVLVAEPASPRSIHPKPTTNALPPHHIFPRQKKPTPYAIHPSIHPLHIQPAACLLPIYHRPPCEPAEETKPKKRIKKEKQEEETKRRHPTRVTPKPNKNHFAFPFVAFPPSTFFPAGFAAAAAPAAAAVLLLSYLPFTSPFHTVPNQRSHTVKKGCEKLVLIPQLWWWMSWYAALLDVTCCSGSQGSA